MFGSDDFLKMFWNFKMCCETQNDRFECFVLEFSLKSAMFGKCLSDQFRFGWNSESATSKIMNYKDGFLGKKKNSFFKKIINNLIIFYIFFWPLTGYIADMFLGPPGVEFFIHTTLLNLAAATCYCAIGVIIKCKKGLHFF